eukprot:TRINITY_DN15650_c0_g2_i7.p1 TRINITY_DN15650_c0_g2~~TRINITY_DN15650_c0_g2_i7.p1  ORF type:complete len:208 (+),score=35.18 TRINITY_DN15650_c0_g2_i7:501-1124(+)
MGAVWDRHKKCFTCKTPPKSWFIANQSSSEGQAENPSEAKTKIRLTLNGQDWIWVGYFEYYDPVVDRMSFDLDFGEGMTEEEKQAKLLEREEVTVPEDPEELKKYLAEEEKRIEEEKELFESSYQRCGTVFYIHGKNFKDSNVGIVLPVDDKSEVHVRRQRLLCRRDIQEQYEGGVCNSGHGGDTNRRAQSARGHIVQRTAVHQLRH